MLTRTLRSWIGARLRMHRFKRQFRTFARMSASAAPRFELRWEERNPRFGDDTATTGFDRHYVYHPAWAARIVRRINPAEHVDISSTLHFCSMLSAFIPVRFHDYRPADLQLSGLVSGRADLGNLPFADGSVASLSCMHTVEHIGLGRYGDPLDPEGDLKAMAELQRVVAPGGSLLFVVPVGAPRIHFNAHRIYAHRQVVEAFPGMELREFALVPDDPGDGGLIVNATAEQSDAQHYGCGCFWFVKTGRA